jgi:hypothetical protein
MYLIAENMKIVTVSLYMSNGLLNADETIFRLNCYLYNVFDQSYFFVYTLGGTPLASPTIKPR